MRTVDETLTPTDDPRIGLDARGRPWVFGANIRVEEIVEGFFAPPESTVESYAAMFLSLKPEHVRAALDYYAAHKEATDEQIRRGREEYERLRQQHESTPASREWRAKMWRLKTERERPS